MIDVATFAIGFGLMLGLMLLGLHVAVALFGIALLGVSLYFGMPIISQFGNMMWSALNNFILVAIPLYILLGEILLRAGITERMYAALSHWFARLPGGLLHTNIAASAMFASVSGSSVATAATIGTVALPAFRARRYNERLVVGSIASGATLGILIPPSINMIIYGALTETSIGQLFIAGILPGVLLAVLFMAVIAALCLIRPRLAGRRDDPPPLAARLRSLVDLLPPLVIFLLVMGGIYFGWATPTESAALGVLFALITAGLYGRLSFAMLHEAFAATVRISAMALLIFVAAQMLSFTTGLLGVPQALTRLLTELEITPAQTIWVLALFYLILGCFIETLTMLFATIPIVFPIILAVGIDPVWFGVFLVLMMEMALITPPIGMNLYVVQGVRGGGPVADVMIGVMPFLAALLLMVGLIIFLPEIVLFLPRHMFTSAS